jgi:hypothetical protein
MLLSVDGVWESNAQMDPGQSQAGREAGRQAGKPGSFEWPFKTLRGVASFVLRVGPLMDLGRSSSGDRIRSPGSLPHKFSGAE